MGTAPLQAHTFPSSVDVVDPIAAISVDSIIKERPRGNTRTIPANYGLFPLERTLPERKVSTAAANVRSQPIDERDTAVPVGIAHSDSDGPPGRLVRSISGHLEVADDGEVTPMQSPLGADIAPPLGSAGFHRLSTPTTLPATTLPATPTTQQVSENPNVMTTEI